MEMKRWTLGLLFAVGGATACSGAAAPTMDDLAGEYEAAIFTTQETGAGVVNQLSLGSFIELTLSADGTTMGRLFVRDGTEGGGDLDADLTGRWTLAGHAVTLDHAADTFLRDVTFTVDGDRLVTEASFSGGTINVVLEKQ